MSEGGIDTAEKRKNPHQKKGFSICGQMRLYLNSLVDFLKWLRALWLYYCWLWL